jgi:hypothetical protein
VSHCANLPKDNLAGVQGSEGLRVKGDGGPWGLNLTHTISPRSPSRSGRDDGRDDEDKIEKTLTEIHFDKNVFSKIPKFLKLLRKQKMKAE